MMKPEHILITGASGLVGTRLTEMLLESGYSVSHLSLSKKQGTGVKSFFWDVDRFFIEPGALKDVTTIIHLTGANVGKKRWTPGRKKEILESRVRSSALLFDELKRGHHHVKTFIAASAIGYYGIEDSSYIFTEDHPPAGDFMADVTRQWENEVNKIISLDIRVVKLRTGIVLSNRGGALMEIVKPINWFAGAPLGTGSQVISWIHLDDLCAIYRQCVGDVRMHGAFNAVTPDPVTNRALIKAIADILKKPLLLPSIPFFLLKIVLGEMAEYVLHGSTVSANKILGTGFEFRYGTLHKALTHLLARQH